jgi:Ca-activated chloride channel homolog
MKDNPGLKRNPWALCASVAAGVVFLAVPLPTVASPETALRQYEKGDFLRARGEFERLAKQNPEDPRYRFNAGDAAFRQHDFTNAASWFESVLASPDVQLQEKANYNLGNARYRFGESLPDPKARLEQWQQSLGHFEAATKLDPADTNAAVNLNFVRQRIEELQKQMPKQQDKSKGDKQKQDKNQDSQQQQQGQSSQDQNSKDQKQDPGKNDSKPQNPDQGGSKEEAQSKDPSESQGQPPNPQSAAAKEPDKSSAQTPGQSPSGDPKENEGKSSGKKTDGQNTDDSAQAAGDSSKEEVSKPGEMSAVQAERLLDSQKSDEKALVFRAHGNGKDAAERQRKPRRPW